MPTEYFHDNRTFSERHGYFIGASTDSIDSIDSMFDLHPILDIQIKKDTEYCHVCSKKHGKRIYEIKTAYTGKKKVCSNCKFIYNILKREIIDNDNIGAINYIHNTLANLKSKMGEDK